MVSKAKPSKAASRSYHASRAAGHKKGVEQAKKELKEAKAAYKAQKGS